MHEYYLLKLMIPFTDSVITVGLALFCTGTAVDWSSGISSSMSILMQPLYENEHLLPTPELVHTEVIRYKTHYQQQPDDCRPQTCAAAMKEIDKNEYVNLSVLLR